MAFRGVPTDIGREWLARFLANFPAWTVLPTPYSPFAFAKWGEGGWETVGGSDVPQDPELFVGNNDLTIVVDPISYPGFSYYTGKAGTPSAGFPQGLPIDQASELSYIGGATEQFRVRAHLEDTEENDTGSGNPRFFEVGIFDNAVDAGLDSVNHMILYGTFDLYVKDATRFTDADFDIPMDP